VAQVHQKVAVVVIQMGVAAPHSVAAPSEPAVCVSQADKVLVAAKQGAHAQ